MMESRQQKDLVFITIGVEDMGMKFMPLHQSVATLKDEEENETLASIDTTAGLGGDMVILTWKGRRGVVRMSHLLRQWVASFDAEGARRLPVTGPPETLPPEPPPTPPSTSLSAAVERLKEEGDDAKG